MSEYVVYAILVAPPRLFSITECLRVVYRYTSIRERVFCSSIKRQLEATEYGSLPLGEGGSAANEN